jgi:hypothetical protein
MTNRYKFDNTIYRGKPKHLHTLDGKPLIGTSTVAGILSKGGGLSWWASARAVEKLGWIHAKDGDRFRSLEERMKVLRPKFEAIKEMTESEFLICLDEAYKAHSVKLETSAEAGTDMHAELEKYVKNCIKHTEGVPQVADGETEPLPVVIFANWAMANIKQFIASEAHCYSELHWTGGIVDLIFEDDYNGLHLLDFKSAKEAYLSHFLQNAGYDIALSENGIFDADGYFQMKLEKPIVAYWSLPFGMPEPEPQLRTDLTQLKLGFEYALYLHKLENSLL